MATVKRPAKKKAPPAKKISDYHVSVGGKTDPGVTESFDTEGKARNRARAAFEAMIPWCQMYNKAGEDSLLKAIGELNVMSFTFVRKVVCAEFDTHTGTTICVTVWKGALPKVADVKGLF